MSRTTPNTPGFGKGSLDELLWQVTAYTHLMLEAALVDTPLTVASSSMLIAIYEEPGMTVAQMSRRIPKTQQTLSQVAARLEKLELIERRLGSGRGVGLYVTEGGEQMARVALEHEKDVNARLATLLGTGRAATLQALLSETHQLLKKERA